MAGTTGRTWIIPPRGDGSLYMNDLIPVLTSPGTNAITVNSANAFVTTSRSGGVLYVVITTSPTSPSVAQIKAGLNELGIAALKAANQAVSSVGVKTFVLTGLSGGGGLYAHFVQTASNVDSLVVVTPAFFLIGTPTGLAVTAGVTGANEDPVANLTWNVVQGATDYRIYRSTDNVNFLPVGTSPTASYPDTAVSHSVVYYWKVCARSGVAEGTLSISATVKMVAGFTGPLTPPSFVDGTSSDYVFPVSEPNVVVQSLDNTLPAQLTLPAVTPPVLRFTNTGAVETYGPQNFRFRVGVAGSSAALLSNQSASGNTGVAVTMNVVTDKSTGTLYSTMTTQANVPTFTQIAAGQDYLGTTVPAGSRLSQVVSTSGAKSFNHTGFSVGQVRYCHMVHIIGGVPSNIVTLAVTLTTQTSALADWTARSTANGVLWAQRFKSRIDVDRCIAGSTNAIKQAQYQNIHYFAGDGIIGDGCLSMDFPLGGSPGGSWTRPLWPLRNMPPDSDGNTADFNQPGLAATDISLYGSSVNNGNGATFPSSIYPGSWDSNQSGGHFVNPAYASLSPSQYPWNHGSGAQLMYGGGFYLQFRLKFSASRFDPLEVTGKWLMLCGHHSQVNQELVWDAMLSYGSGWHQIYSNQLGNHEALRSPPWTSQDGIQPGGVFAPTCTTATGNLGFGFNNCWTYPLDTWITMMIHVVPGHNMLYTGSDWASNVANIPARDTTIEVFAALPGATQWTTVTSYNQWIMQYDGDYIQTPSGQPWGWSWVNFTPYNGGVDPTPVAVPGGWFHRFDQIICSTQPIALPAI